MCSMMRLACSLAFLVQEAEGAAAFFPYAFAIESRSNPRDRPSDRKEGSMILE